MNIVGSIFNHIYAWAMSVVNHFMDMLFHNAGWLITGVVIWGFAHYQLYRLGEKALGYVVTVLLAALPAMIVVVLAVKFVAEALNGNLWRALLFLALVIGGLVYFSLGGLDNGKVKTKDGSTAGVRQKVRTLSRLQVFKSSPKDTYTKMCLLLFGAISILVIVLLGLVSGWQLIEGSKPWGIGFAIIAVALRAVCQFPERKWNLAQQSYMTVTNLSAELESEPAAQGPAVTDD